MSISPECIGFDLGAVLDVINRAKLKGKSSRSKSLFAITLPSLPKPNLPNIPIPRPRRFSVSLPLMPTFLRSSGNNEGKRRCIPVGTGPCTVGVVDIMSSHSVHGTFMRVFYPTDTTDVLERQHQWPLWLPRKQYIEGYLIFREMNKRLLYKVFNWMGGDVYLPALWQAPVLRSDQKFPVVIFSHGIGANRTTYSTICLELASHGFVVAAIEHRDGSASMTYCLNNQARYYDSHPHLGDIDDLLKPSEHDTNDNFTEQWLKYIKYPVLDDYEVRCKQVYHRVKEVSRCLDLLEAMNDGEKVTNVLGLRFNINQFQGRLDLTKASVVGHSFGGATTIVALAYDKRFHAGVALDCWMLPVGDEVFDLLSQPLLCINTDRFQWRENVLKMMRTKVNMQPDRVLITLRGTCHQSQTDFQFLVKPYVAKFFDLRHTLSPQVAMDLNNKALRGFLYKHLGMEADDYYEDILRGEHPEVVLGTNLNMTSNAPKPNRPTTRVYPDPDSSSENAPAPPIRTPTPSLPRAQYRPYHPCAAAPADLSPVEEERPPLATDDDVVSIITDVDDVVSVVANGDDDVVSVVADSDDVVPVITDGDDVPVADGDVACSQLSEKQSVTE